VQHASSDDFVESAEAHRASLRLHCYRMLGSAHDADDLVQETLVRAWRARGDFEGRAPLRSWLLKIATHACLDELGRRPRRALPTSAGPPSDPAGPIAAAEAEPVWLEPCPDAWMEGVEAGPEASCTTRESVALAFVAALQVLSPEQRAVLLLRDVVGHSAEETARALGLSLGAANSVLHRARASIQGRAAGREPSSFAPRPTDEALLGRYVRAWERADLDALIALLREEVHVTMPPSPTWVSGRAAAGAFFERHVFSWMRAGAARLAPAGANGQPAFAFYLRRGDGGPHELYALQVLEVDGGGVSALHHFTGPELFAAFRFTRGWAEGA
jgi:RNA polymerase sigma-70 factor (ECF subfamily)